MASGLKTRVVGGEEGISEAARALVDGGICAIPTETVYGLAASALDAQACRAIFEAKGRPQDNPLIVHISDMDMADEVAREIPDAARRLMRAFWPGPMSLVLPKSPEIPDVVSAGLSTAAIRMPAHATAREIIRRAGVPLAAPSANRSGRPSPTTAMHVLHDMDGRIPLIVDGGPCDVGVESTVIDVTGSVPVILRQGRITKEQVEDAAGAVICAAGGSEDGTPASPGMKYRHYAPDAKVRVFSGDPAAIAKTIRSLYHTHTDNGGRPVVLCCDADMWRYRNLNVHGLGNGAEDAQHLVFGELRGADARGEDLILFQYTDEMGEAVRDRIVRAAGEEAYVGNI